MEKSVGLAIIAVILSVSSLGATYFIYVTQINGLETNVYENKELSIVEYPFSASYSGEGYSDRSNYYFDIPSVDGKIIARAIIVTIDYQLSSSYSAIFGLFVDKDQSSGPENSITYDEIDLIENDTGRVSLSTGFLLPSTQVDEVRVIIDPFSIGYINGTITQIIIEG